MAYDPKRALELLRIGSGRADATFRDGQEDAIRHIVEGKGRLLVVQKTGWGKSFVYFIATKLLREAGAGPALLISPLLALMRNQIAAAERMGVRAATINSDNMDDWTVVEGKLAKGEIDILLISPERLANERFRTQVLAGIAAQISMLVIDEAHCISDWGHDFRPHYRLLERIVKTLPPNLRLLATTATANTLRSGRAYRPRPTRTSRPRRTSRVRATLGRPSASRSRGRMRPRWAARSRMVWWGGTLRQTYVTQRLTTASNSCGKARNPAPTANNPTSSAPAGSPTERIRHGASSIPVCGIEPASAI